MKKRLLATGLLIALIACTASCGKKEDAKVEGTLPVSMMVINKSDSNNQENFMIKKIFKDKFDIDLELSQNVETSHFEKLNLLIASNELPDIVSPFPIEETKKVGIKGALIPVDENLDIMPNLAKYIKEDKVAYTSMLASDGHIYGAPKINERKEYKNTPIIRADFVKEAGKEIPTTMAEVIDVLKAIKANHPEVTGVVNRFKADALRNYGIMYNTSTGMMYNKETDKWEYGPLNPGYKEMITDFNTLNNEKLLDSEFFTSSNEQWEEKVINGRGVFFLDWPSRAQTEEDMFRKLNPDNKSYDLKLMMPLTTNSSQKMRLNVTERIASYTSYGISSKAKDKERLLKAIDYLYSDEGAELLQWGVKDEHFILENGKKKFMGHIKAGYNPDATVNIAGSEGINSAHILRVAKDDGINMFPQEVQDMTVHYDSEVESFETDYGIKLNFTEEQQDRIRVINNNIETRVQETSVKMILGDISLAEYDAFINDIAANGAKELEEIYAEAYEEFKKQLGEDK